MSDTQHGAFVRSFTPSSKTDGDPSPSTKEGVLHEFSDIAQTAPTRKTRENFVFDSSEARNFDATSIKGARLGVKEILKDALEKAKNQAVQLKGQARQEGFEQGRKEGFDRGQQDAKEEFIPLIQGFQKLVQDLSEFRKKMYPRLEREMIELVVELAKKVVHQELSAREDSVKEMIHAAVQEVLDKEYLTIRVHPQDKEHAETFEPELKKMYGEIKNIKVEPHEGITRGGCEIETNFGTIDTRIEKMDEQIDKILHLAPPPEDPSPQN